MNTFMTKDNVQIRIQAFLFYRSIRPELSTFKAESDEYLLSKRAQGELMKAVSILNLDDILINRNLVSKKVLNGIEQDATNLGFEVYSVEIQSINMSNEMEQALAAMALGTVQSKANMISAQNELEVANLLQQAAGFLKGNPIGLQLEYIEALRFFAEGRMTTLVMPDSIIGGGKGFHIPEKMMEKINRNREKRE